MKRPSRFSIGYLCGVTPIPDRSKQRGDEANTCQFSRSEALPELGGLHHIGIVVPWVSQDALASNLIAALDAKLVNGGEDAALDVRWQWLATPYAPILELLSPRSDASTPITGFIERSGGGIHHLSFQTAGIEACRARFAERGVPMAAYNPDHDGWAEFFLDPRATFGALFHWMEPISTQRIQENRGIADLDPG